MPIAQTLLPEFDQEMAITRNLLACVPADRAGWQPHPRSTLGQRQREIDAHRGFANASFATGNCEQLVDARNLVSHS